MHSTAFTGGRWGYSCNLQWPSDFFENFIYWHVCGPKDNSKVAIDRYIQRICEVESTSWLTYFCYVSWWCYKWIASNGKQCSSSWWYNSCGDWWCWWHYFTCRWQCSTYGSGWQWQWQHGGWHWVESIYTQRDRMLREIREHLDEVYNTGSQEQIWYWQDQENWWLNAVWDILKCDCKMWRKYAMWWYLHVVVFSHGIYSYIHIPICDLMRWRLNTECLTFLQWNLMWVVLAWVFHERYLWHGSLSW